MYDSLGPFYDLIHQEHTASSTGREVAFLRWAFEARAQRPVHDVLDLGAGTGRLALPLAKAGHAVTALDASPAMLAHLRDKAAAANVGLTVLEGRMETIEHDQAFDALVCAHETFAHLVEDEIIEQALRRWWTALRPGGMLVFDVVNPLHAANALPPERFSHHVHGDVRLFRHVTHRVDDVACVCRREEACFVDDEGRSATFVETIPLRIMTANETLGWLRDAHFDQAQVFRGFQDRGDEVGNTDRLVFTALRPA